jgi:hypothetical protein
MLKKNKGDKGDKIEIRVLEEIDEIEEKLELMRKQGTDEVRSKKRLIVLESST